MKKYLSIVLVCLSYFGFAQTNYVVTFKVNTANITVGSNGLYLGGGVIGGANAIQLTDADGNGVYEGTDTLSGAGGGNFIFLNSPSWSGDWGTKENLTGLACADVSNYNDRILPSFTQDTTLMFCFGTCATDTLCTTTYTPSSCGDLFFSEYSEGSSNNKYFEIYNPTSAAISLSDYTVYLSGNGGSYTNTFTTNASIASGDVYMISTNQLDSATQALADTAMGYPSVAHFNGDDALILVNGTDTIDVIGTPGVDPGSSWTVGTGSTANHTLVRKATVDMGSTDWTVGATEWDVNTQNTWTYAGAHSSNCIVTPKNVTFQVDMSYVTASFTNVYVSGTLNNWSGNSNQLTDADGDGVYEGTLSLLPGSYEYKFTYDNWTGQESLNATLDSACTLTTGSFTNRYATVGNADTTLPVVCWEDCAACAGPTDFVVTFMVNTANITVGTNGLYLGGGVIGGANAVQLLDPDGDGIYVGTDTLNGSNGGNFIFLNSPAYASDWGTKENLAGLTCSDPSNYNDRILPTFTQDTTLMFCFGTCSTDTSCTVQSDFVVTFKVNTANITVGSNGLYLGGGVIGGANAIQLTDADGNGVYEGTDTLSGAGGGNFIFLNSPANAFDWNTKENLAGLACADASNYNDRILPSFTQDTTLMFCFGTCSTDTLCTTAYSPSSCGDLFFSEYSEGSSNNKYFEIYNPTSAAISLSGYTVYLSGNGGSYTNTFTTNASIASGDVYMISTNQLDSATQALADTAMGYPSVAHFNGDDALILVNGTDTIDVIGTPGVDPGSSWTVGTGSTANHTLVRKATVDMGSTDWTVGATEWDVNTQNTWTYAGAHTSNCVSAVTGCNELFFSEYSEGSSNHKYIEIYNPTANTVSLNTYTVYQSGNGGSYTNTFTTNAMLASGDVYMIATNQADATIQAAADTVLAYPSIAHFNGDDAMILVSGTDTVDVIGVPGVDPGSSWTVGTGSTANHTLVRKATIDAGSTDWTTGATEWDVYAQNTWTYMGAHTSNCIFAAPAPTFDSVVAINTFNSNDANGVVDSLGAMKWIKVIVTSIDFDGNAGYSFYAEDATDGINIFNFADQSGYTAPMMGDSLYIHGEVEQYQGLTELKPDSIYLLSSGNALPAASIETTLDETTESELIQLIGFTLADATQWPAAGSSTNVDITNGTDTMTMRVRSDTDIDGTPAPTGTFDVTGIGSQYDFSSPYDEGYQIFPRQLTDIYEYPTIPMYQISDVTYVDAMGMPDSLNVLCKLEGIVLGVDMQGSATAVSFTLHDGVDGIGTYGSLANYTVAEGDSVRIIGSIGQYNGMLQMVLDSVVLISSNNTLPTTPTVVTALGENTESELIKFENATIVDPSQWSGGSGYSVDITNGTDTIVMRIDADTDIYGTAAPTGVFDVVGIGGQFTFNAGDFDGYQLLPRYQADITPAAGVVAVKLSVSEIMSGSNSTAYNADWFEIHNYGDSAVDLTGYSWDDESEIPGTSTFPSVTIQAGQAIVVLDDVAANKDDFLAEWKLYAGSVTIVANDELTGSFPSLSQNGDAVFLYDANGAEMASGVYTTATAGFAVEFDTTGAFLGDAVDGTNGAYTSLEGDVGSPGNLTPNTGVGEAAVISSIFPNPTTGSFTVNLTSAVSYEATITSITGATVFHKEGTGAELNIDLDAARGTYVLRVRTAQGTAVQMIVLQ